MSLVKPKKLKLTDYEVFQTLGTGLNKLNKIKGSFGRVRLARNKTTNKYVALKSLKKAEIIRLKQVDHVISENTILGNLSHPFIVNYLYMYRLLLKDSVKTQDIYIQFQNMFKEENYSLI